MNPHFFPRQYAKLHEVYKARHQRQAWHQTKSRTQPNTTTPTTLTSTSRTTPTTPTTVTSTSLPSQLPSLYKGWDVHSYTSDMRQLAPYLTRSSLLWYNQDEKVVPHLALLRTDAEQLLHEISLWIGAQHPATLNLYHSIQWTSTTAQLLDPDLPNSDVLIVLYRMWWTLKQLKEPSLWCHFRETWDDINMTCKQGITHRILSDACVILNSTLVKEEKKEREVVK